MSKFERIYHIDPSREIKHERERTSIELTDQEHLERVIISRNFREAGFIYKPPVDSEVPTQLKEKFELAKKLTKDTKVVDLRKKDAKSKSKSPARKSKKVNTKSNTAAMASVQTE